jgi:hypothetical protein
MSASTLRIGSDSVFHFHLSPSSKSHPLLMEKICMRRWRKPSRRSEASLEEEEEVVEREQRLTVVVSNQLWDRTSYDVGPQALGVTA